MTDSPEQLTYPCTCDWEKHPDGPHADDCPREILLSELERERERDYPHPHPRDVELAYAANGAVDAAGAAHGRRDWTARAFLIHYGTLSHYRTATEIYAYFYGAVAALTADAPTISATAGRIAVARLASEHRMAQVLRAQGVAL